MRAPIASYLDRTGRCRKSGPLRTTSGTSYTRSHIETRLFCTKLERESGERETYKFTVEISIDIFLPKTRERK